MNGKSTYVLLACLFAGCGSKPPAPAPTMGTASPVRGELHIEREGHSLLLVAPERIELAATVSTAANARGTISTDGGAFVLLDQGTELECELNRMRLTHGRVWVDASAAEATAVVTSGGTVTGEGASFAVSLTPTGVEVYCASGELNYQSAHGSGQIAQGETAHLSATEQARVGGADLWDDWTGGLANPASAPMAASPSVGVLLARKLEATGVARTPLATRSHDVHVTIHGDFATTSVSQTFFNAQSEVLEAEYRLRLPDNAIIGSFAVDQGSGPVAGTVVPRQAATAEQPTWGNANDAASALVYDGPHRVRARVYPIAPGAVVTISLTYSEWITHRDDLRTYVYPMHDGGTASLIGELDLSVDIDGPVRAVRAGMGATVDKSHIRLRRSDFRPRADFVLDLYDAAEEQSHSAQAFVVQGPAQPGDEDSRFVLLDVPTSQLAQPIESAAPPLDLVLLVDASGGTDGADFDLARTTVDAILRQLQPTDRVAIRTADVNARIVANLGGGFLTATTEHRELIAEALSHVEPGGATDLAASLRDAAALVADKARGTVIYLGDGQPTTGPVDVVGIRSALAELPRLPRFFALGVGDGANMELLRDLVHDSAFDVHERTEAVRVAMQLLASAAQPVLRGVTVLTGPAIERSFPRMLASSPVGEHIRIIGRLRDTLPGQVTVNGTLDGVAFTKDVPLHLATLVDGGDVARRWATSRLEELLDAQAGREAIVELGVRYAVVTPWTAYVIAAATGSQFAFVPTFDLPPDDVTCGALHRGCAEAYVLQSVLGSHQRNPWQSDSAQNTALPALPETTWTSRVGEATERAPTAAGDGGLARVSIMQTLQTRQAGPTSCVERKRTVRPDLAGAIAVRVDVDGSGAVRLASASNNTLGDPDVTSCILAEVRGLHFAPTGGGATISVTQVYTFGMRTDDTRQRHACSDASRQALEVRDSLWRERLAANAGVEGATSVWNAAIAQCELGAWRDRRVLLDRMMRHVGGVGAQLQLYRSLQADASVRSYMRQAILRHVSSPEDVLMVRSSLGIEPPLEWKVFAQMWRNAESPAARLSLVRRWLGVAVDDIDLRLRLLALLEETHALPEAARVARELVRDPLADVRVRTLVGEFYLRQNQEGEARRVFSQSAEVAPTDPWGREHLGNLYRAHGWMDDAYREYQALARLRPNDASVLLLLARAANDAGRIDEGLRLVQRLSESVDPDLQTGSAEIARAWSLVALAQLRAGVHGNITQELIHERERETGILRDPPDVFVALVWKHPDDRPELWMRQGDDGEPARAAILGDAFGIEGIRMRETDDSVYQLTVRRVERDSLRDVEAELWVVTHPGTENVRVEHQPVRLTRSESERAYRFSIDSGLSEFHFAAH